MDYPDVSRARAEKQLRDLTEFLSHYKWLLDSYISDYFVCSLHKNIPVTWWEILSDSQPEELASLLDPGHWASRRVWPLSLMAFRCVVTRLTEDRTPIMCRGDGRGSADVDLSSVKTSQNKHLGHCYRKHVKPKKQHEILRLGELIKQTCLRCSCHQVVDVGSGQGHLARLLSFGHGLDVRTVEASSFHQPKAQKFDKEVIIELEKKRKRITQNMDDDLKQLLEVNSMLPPADFLQPLHIVSRIDPAIPVKEFLATLRLENISQENELERESDIPREIFTGMSNSDENSATKNMASQGASSSVGYSPNAENSSCRRGEQLEGPSVQCGQQSARVMLTGLHACGDLTPTLLRVFSQCPQISAIAAVGCCYMKCTTSHKLPHDQESESVGYPMSDYIRSIQHHHLTYESREMACHFIDSYVDRLKANSENLQTHVYRAALQDIILQVAPHIKHGCIKIKLKYTHQMSFQRYVETALNKLGVDGKVSECQIAQAEARLQEWRHVLAFYTLRLSLAPIVELVILLDRALYLIEQGHRCWLLPVFDPRLSPRNFVILASKNEQLKHITT